VVLITDIKADLFHLVGLWVWLLFDSFRFDAVWFDSICACHARSGKSICSSRGLSNCRCL